MAKSNKDKGRTDKVRLYALHPVKLDDGSRAERGEEFAAPSDVAKRLIAKGAAEPVDLVAPDPAPPKPPEELSVRQLQEHLQTVEDPEDVLYLLDQELAKDDPRKTAVEILEERLAELENPVPEPPVEPPADPVDPAVQTDSVVTDPADIGIQNNDAKDTDSGEG